MKRITYNMHHAIVITINAQFSNNPKFRNGKLTPSSKWKTNLEKVVLRFLHAVSQMGMKSKWDESQNAANGDENVKYSVQNA